MGKIEVIVACDSCVGTIRLCDANKSLPSFVKRQITTSRCTSLRDIDLAKRPQKHSSSTFDEKDDNKENLNPILEKCN
jgi:disulfide oxidoreductase YuzD